ncbi:MAG: ABC transporter permease [Rhodomicrobiaceae bacterium]
MSTFRYRLIEHRGTLLAAAVLATLLIVYITNSHSGLNAAVATNIANKGVLLAIVAMAQTLPILTAGLDLSVGMIFVLANCLASALVVGTPLETAFGIVVVLAVGLLCGLVNGLIIVYGRLQPIITTLATGAVYFGLALWLRPVPGGDVNADLADAVTGQLPGGIPAMLAVLLAVVLLIWVPFRNSVIGRGAYAIGSSETASYMSGIPIGRVKIVVYALAGLLASIAGILLTFVTYSGEASASIGGTYTLNSIASVVIGGTSLMGGFGSAIGSIFGAFVLRSIEDLLFVMDLDPLWQPLFQGIVLLVAVSLGAFRLLRLSNRLKLFN